jgi:hypothetical protein
MATKAKKSGRGRDRKIPRISQMMSWRVHEMRCAEGVRPANRGAVMLTEGAKFRHI